jgi:homocysteine S-methyltransferase
MIAREHGVGLALDTPTWRASPEWGERLGYDADRLAEVNRKGVRLLQDLREQHPDVPLTISGCIGPRGDGYVASELMTADEAERFHSAQVETLAAAGADTISALTMTYAAEAIGIVRAAQKVGLPPVVSFTVETDGRLPDGTALGDAIEHVDAETGGAPTYFMVNCAHPTHFAGVLEGPWVQRLGGIRANASTMSHAELDEAEELDDGDPDELAQDYLALRSKLPNVHVVGGCCGTDHRHIAAIASAWTA